MEEQIYRQPRRSGKKWILIIAAVFVLLLSAVAFVLREGTVQQEYRHKRIGKGCHGTGDIFAAVFTGALMQGKNRLDAAKIAADFTCRCIKNTVNAPAHWYGVKFEPLLPELMEILGR